MQKLTKLREQFEEADIDGLLVTNSFNRRYITGFTGTAGNALITKDQAIFITDFRYVTQAAEQAKAFTIVQHQKSMEEEIANQIKANGIKRLGFEKNDITYGTYSKFSSMFDTELVPSDQLIETIRMYKDNSELKIMKEAAEIADAVL